MVYVAVALAWGASASVSALVSPSEALGQVALSLHVLALAVGFGAVIVVDWHALLWLMGARGLRESARLAAAARPLIWLGLAGLLVSGAMLEPDLGSGLTWVKLSCVLVIALNGVSMIWTTR